MANTQRPQPGSACSSPALPPTAPPSLADSLVDHPAATVSRPAAALARAAGAPPPPVSIALIAAPQRGSSSVLPSSSAATPSPRAATSAAPPMGTPSRPVAALLGPHAAPRPPHSVAPVAAPQVASSFATAPLHARATLPHLSPAVAVASWRYAFTPTPTAVADVPPAASVHRSCAAAPVAHIAAPPPILGKHGVTCSLFELDDDNHADQHHRNATLRRARNSPPKSPLRRIHQRHQLLGEGGCTP